MRKKNEINFGQFHRFSLFGKFSVQATIASAGIERKLEWSKTAIPYRNSRLCGLAAKIASALNMLKRNYWNQNQGSHGSFGVLRPFHCVALNIFNQPDFSLLKTTVCQEHYSPSFFALAQISFPPKTATPT
ncbi:MAG: hypothetical protein MUC59_17935 [Saprospiraceae bacterium]|nr:hypothetical protein [Saprospiraceae bacterium]